jgi:hypothetical protein
MFAGICSALTGSSWCPDVNYSSRSAPALETSMEKGAAFPH